MPQSLLHAGKKRLFVAGLHIDDTTRQQAHLGQRRREEIRPRHAPQNFAPVTGADGCGKQRCGGAVNRTVAATSDFMERTKSQPTTGKTVVNCGYAERKHRATACHPAFKPLDAFAQLGDNRIDNVVTHAKWHLLQA